MDMTHTYWEENSNIQSVKYERLNTNEDPARIKDDRTIYPYCDSNLNFSTATCSEDDCEYGPYKKSKVARQDPMSHRIIEKRRRDRMNNCLADLSRLIPPEYLKKGRGRIEKTEIIEMAIKHMKHLQAEERVNPVEHYRLGYQECMSEAIRFMVEVEGHLPREPICVRLVNHLQKYCEQISKGHQGYLSSPVLEQVPHFTVQVPTLLKNEIHNKNTIQSKICEFSVPKSEPENSNSNDAHPHAFVIKSKKTDDLEKDLGTNGMSYKYKTSIKLRFNQDLNAQEVPKRLKLNGGRRNSITSFENHSSNQSSPPSSEPCTRISENDNTSRQTPPEIAVENNNHHKLDTSRTDMMQEFSPNSKVQNSLDQNFNVPIFALHAKGAYYVPLTIDYKTLLPYLQNYNILDLVPTMHNIVLHPITINVNFLPKYNGTFKPNNYKYEYNNNWH